MILLPQNEEWGKNAVRSSTRRRLIASVVAKVLVSAVTLWAVHVYRVMKVTSVSMKETLAPGDLIVVDTSHTIFKRWAGHATHFSRGMLVVVAQIHPEMPAVKRVIGAAGDHIRIEGGVVILNGMAQAEEYVWSASSEALRSERWPLATSGDANDGVVIPPCHYFILGDNRAESLDSRDRGSIPERSVLGRVVFVWHRSQS